MVTLELTRWYGAPGFTWGTMKEPQTGFSCRTMERRDAKHWMGMKNYCAIPAGRYKLKVVTRDNLKLNLKLSMTGAYRNAELTDAKVPYEQPAGCICVGKSINRDKCLLEGGAVVMDGIDAWIRRLMYDGRISTKMKTGELVLVVNYAEGYYYDEKAKGGKEEERKDEEHNDHFDFAE